MRDSIFNWAQGNGGAIYFLSLLNDLEHFTVINKLEVAISIRGTNLHILFKDLCGEDMSKVIALCKYCPTSILEDACSRQDRSGQALVAPYFSPKKEN